MVGLINRQWQIADRPIGRALADGDFRWTESPVPPIEAGQVLVRILYLGFDPAQKGWMENISDYVAPTQIGQVMPGLAIGEVVTSTSESFAAGDKVFGWLGWQDYAAVSSTVLTRIDDDEFLTAHLGIFGTSGPTALFGLKKVGRPFPGDTMVVTGAAGATGSIVGQIGKIAGCRVIGIAGGLEKCRWLRELGFDEAVDYKSQDVESALRSFAPSGFDLVWDNVGGPMLDLVLAQIARDARVVLCGGISRYDIGQAPIGPRNYFNLILQRATMQGFITLDHMDQLPWAQARLREWIRQGKIRYREDVQTGLENAPRTLMRLFEGKNIGKQILKI